MCLFVVIHQLEGDLMDKIKTVEDFKKFLNNNRDKLLDLAVNIKDLPPDNEWI
jgi:hypothetical protein